MTVPSASPSRLSWRKRILFSVLTAIGAGLFIELASLVAVLMRHGSFAALLVQRHRVAARDSIQPLSENRLPVVIHPYLGATLQRPDDGGSPADGDGFRSIRPFCERHIAP